MAHGHQELIASPPVSNELLCTATAYGTEGYFQPCVSSTQLEGLVWKMTYRGYPTAMATF